MEQATEGMSTVMVKVNNRKNDKSDDPKVKTRIKWSNVRSVDMSYARILLGSTNLNSDIY